MSLAFKGGFPRPGESILMLVSGVLDAIYEEMVVHSLDDGQFIGRHRNGFDSVEGGDLIGGGY
jgi:hypothetical protein